MELVLDHAAAQDLVLVALQGMAVADQRTELHRVEAPAEDDR
jgi:hypothetical protein